MQVRFLEVAFLGQKYAHLNFILPGDFQKCVSNLHIRQQCLRGMFSPHFCQSRLDPLFKISVSLIHENDLFISLVYISLTTTVLQHLFKCSVAICVPHQIIARSPCAPIFLLYFLSFVHSQESLSIKEISALSYLLQIFFPSLSLNFLMVPLTFRNFRFLCSQVNPFFNDLQIFLF